MEPPLRIDGADVIEWAWSDQPFGAVAAGDGSAAIPIHGLALCRYPGAAEVYRFSCDRRWETQQAAAYESVAAAKAGLPDQYRGAPAEWRQQRRDDG